MKFTVYFGGILMHFSLPNALKLTLEFSKMRFCKRLVLEAAAGPRFEDLDANNDGVITKDEWNAYLHQNMPLPW